MKASQLAITPETPVRRIGSEQSNSLFVVDDRLVLKMYRRLEAGPHPELEVARFLTEVAGFTHVPQLLGSIENRSPDGGLTAYAALFAFVSSLGNGWEFTLHHLDRELEQIRLMPEGDQPTDRELHEGYLAVAAQIGRRTAELHRALTTVTDDPAFAPEPCTAADLTAIRDTCRSTLAEAFALLDGMRATVPEALGHEIDALRERRPVLEALLAEVPAPPPGLVKTRRHGDYRLAQVLVAQGDIMLVDFEGEAGRPLAERRAKGLALSDVAGMIRSFDLAAWTSLSRFAETDAQALGRLAMPTRTWAELAIAAFFNEYRTGIEGCTSWPGEAVATTVLRWEILIRLGRDLLRDAAVRPARLGASIDGLNRMAMQLRDRPL